MASTESQDESATDEKDFQFIKAVEDGDIRMIMLLTKDIDQLNLEYITIACEIAQENGNSTAIKLTKHTLNKKKGEPPQPLTQPAISLIHPPPPPPAPPPPPPLHPPPSTNSATQLTSPRPLITLEEITKVKLKKIKRLPDGTPVQLPAKHSDHHDLASILNNTLKKRFASIHGGSPEKNNEESDFSDDKYDITPALSKEPANGQGVNHLISQRQEKATAVNNHTDVNHSKSRIDEVNAEDTTPVAQHKDANHNDPCNDTVNTEDGTAAALQQDVNHSDSALKEKATAVNEHTDINHSKSRSDEVDAEYATPVAQHKDVNQNDPCNDTVNTEDGTAEALQQDVNHSDSALKIISDTLKDLGLEEVLSYRFEMKDILIVTRSSLEGQVPQTLKDKLGYIISRMIMLDYRSRDIEVCPTSTKHQEKEIEAGLDDQNEMNSLLNEINEGFQENTQNLLHPSDVFVILMNCCDNILRQILVQKMSVCKLAIPLVHPNFESSNPLFLLWAMRFVNMNLKTQSKEEQDSNENDYIIPIVSAIRLGAIPLSKSRILNEILYKQPHNIYFHKDCNSGNLSRKLSNGVLELAWYLPGGRKEDNFDKMMALANLRGDAKNHNMQFEFLNTISSITLVFLSTQKISDPEYYPMLEKLCSSRQELIFIFLDTVNQKSLTEFKNIIGNRKFSAVLKSVQGQVKNAAKFTTELRSKINLSMKTFFESQSIGQQQNWESISNFARKHGIKVDEDSQICQKAKRMANDVMSNLKNKPIATMKEKVLPLQGQLWSEWSQSIKKQARLDGVLGKDHEIFISEQCEKQDECRQSQYNMVKNMNQSMNSLIQNLIQTRNNPELRINFMQFMKLQLDVISHKELPKLHKNYHSLWNKLQNYKKKKNNDPEGKQLNDDEMKEKIKTIQEELDVVENNLIASSFGLEHFMREVGQVYEAIVGVRKNKSDEFNNFKLHLPQFAADLLISGSPLEIIDGDVANMPLTWVKAVFDCLKSSLGDKRVFVISVLGVQSSGKSTLLNTMFGLNFAVSAGRCTKGAYAQLIPVEEDLIIELKYEYILILDTEGIRAPELGKSKLTHDNELATLVIGLGDITIVNIKGENMAELEDILQISVHAFLKMQLVNKSIKLQPGCYFVHQNVPAVDAAEKMQDGYKKILEKLDSITKAAAEQEGTTNIQYFRDIIEFDVDENVLCFSSLWLGDPPMAPANPSYSEKVLELKNSVLKYPSQKSINCLTFTDLTLRMSDLWNAILCENFLFSFKNGLEVKAYSSLEEKYSSLSWKFRNEVIDWVNGSLNEIQICKEENISSLHVSKVGSLSSFITENVSRYKSEMDAFFETAKEKEILAQWQKNTEFKLQNLSDELERDEKKTLASHFEIRKAQFIHEKKTESYQHQLHLEVKKLVSSNAVGKMNDDTVDKDDKLNKVFDEKWDEWMKILCLDKMEKKDIIGDIRTILSDYFTKNAQLLQNVIAQYDPIEKEDCEFDCYPNIDDEDYAPNSSFRNKLRQLGESLRLINRTEQITAIKKFTDETVKEIKTYINEKQGHDYDKTFVFKICCTVNDKVKKFNSINQSYELQAQYLIKLTVHILLNAVPLFKTLHNTFRMKNDPQLFLQDTFKPQLLKFFMGTVKQCMKEKTAAEMLISSLETAILASMKRELPSIIADNVRSSNLEFHTKSRLYAKVLGDLLTTNRFDKYKDFISNANNSLQEWLKKYVADYCKKVNENGKRTIVNAANEILKNIVSTLENCVKEVNTTVGTNGISFQNWFKKYSEVTVKTVALIDNLFNIFGSEKIKYMDDFEKDMLLGLGNLKVKLEQQFNTWSEKELDTLDEEPHILIAKNILGCTAQCPFCETICTNTMPGCTSHSNPQHYSKGIAGGYHIESEKLDIASCNVDVASNDEWFKCNDMECKCWSKGSDKIRHYFKKYKEAGGDYASWNITPDTSLEGSAYWKFVFCKFSKEFAEYHEHECPDIPSFWSTITEDEARESIKAM